MPIRRGSFAITGTDERVQLRFLLVGRIVADPEFAAALRALFETYVSRLEELPHWSELPDQVLFDNVPGSQDPATGGDPDIAAYVAAVRALAERWGLDRLIATRPELGSRLIHGWCRSRRAAGREVPVGRLLHGVTEAHRVAEIGEVVARSVTELEDLRVVDELVRPVVRVEVIDEWDPTRESRASARKRLRALAESKIRGELDRLAADAESKGYRFVDRAPALDRDLDRLFQLMAKGATVADLIRQTGRDALDVELAVNQSVRKIAERTGVSVRGWKLTRG